MKKRTYLVAILGLLALSAPLAMAGQTCGDTPLTPQGYAKFIDQNGLDTKTMSFDRAKALLSNVEGECAPHTDPMTRQSYCAGTCPYSNPYCSPKVAKDPGAGCQCIE